LLLFRFSGVRVHGTSHQLAFQHRGDVRFREQDPSANSPVLRAFPDQTTKRLGADLHHRSSGFGGVDFHQNFVSVRLFGERQVSHPVSEILAPLQARTLKSDSAIR